MHYNEIQKIIGIETDIHKRLENLKREEREISDKLEAIVKVVK
jgi:predicted CopG family antitoxin